MERNVLADRLKGYACFLVLFGHVIMGMRNAGIDMPSFFFGLEKFIWSYHVALFLFLSGAVYVLTGEWKSKKTKGNFLKHKLINLGVPYVVFSVVYIAINSLSGQANTQSSYRDILYIWKTPTAQYWYLYALFFLFCIWTICSGTMKNPQITAFVVLAGYLAPFFDASFGSFAVVVYSALAFGLGTCVEISKIENKPVLVKMILIFLHIAIGGVLVIADKIEAAFFKELMIVLGIGASICFISLMQKIKPMARFLDFMNKYSFRIYLLHTIFTAGIRVILMHLGIAQWSIHILLGTLVGIVCSVVVAIVAQKIKWMNIVFFPTKTYAGLVRKKQTDK